MKQFCSKSKNILSPKHNNDRVIGHDYWGICCYPRWTWSYATPYFYGVGMVLIWC